MRTWNLYFDDLRELEDWNEFRSAIGIELSKVVDEKQIQKILANDKELKYIKIPESKCVRSSYPHHNMVSIKLGAEAVYPAFDEYVRSKEDFDIYSQVPVSVERYDVNLGQIEYFKWFDPEINKIMWSIMD